MLLPLNKRLLFLLSQLLVIDLRVSEFSDEFIVVLYSIVFFGTIFELSELISSSSIKAALFVNILS